MLVVRVELSVEEGVPDKKMEKGRDCFRIMQALRVPPFFVFCVCVCFFFEGVYRYSRANGETQSRQT